ncbi:MAG: hypothetical protein R3E90_13405 [Marinicella sp.]|nr:hypothetical protein [Xanthomonadales bacterium]
MKYLVFLFVALAFFGGAFLTSLDKELVNWMYFLPLMLLGFGAAFMFRKLSHAENKQGHVLQNNKKVLIESLGNILTNLEALDGNKENIPTYEMRFEIDKLFREDLLNFADARESMKHIFGLQHYADIMSSFAAGERYINRVWSASTDGYIDEVMMYVEKSLSQFQHAKEEFDKALAEAS